MLLGLSAARICTNAADSLRLLEAPHFCPSKGWLEKNVEGFLHQFLTQGFRATISARMTFK
jgi:hypothetical protein